jgi:hypothetical protein
MNASWRVTAQYPSLRSATTLGLFTFEDDAHAFARSARRRYSGATVLTEQLDLHVDLPDYMEG